MSLRSSGGSSGTPLSFPNWFGACGTTILLSGCGPPMRSRRQAATGPGSLLLSTQSCCDRRREHRAGSAVARGAGAAAPSPHPGGNGHCGFHSPRVSCGPQRDREGLRPPGVGRPRLPGPEPGSDGDRGRGDGLPDRDPGDACPREETSYHLEERVTQYGSIPMRGRCSLRSRRWHTTKRLRGRPKQTPFPRVSCGKRSANVCRSDRSVRGGFPP